MLPYYENEKHLPINNIIAGFSELPGTKCKAEITKQ